jgi:uncharacterized LabA/DUF88 family protein
LKTAFLIDGDFFLRRLKAFRGRQSAEQVVADLVAMVAAHLSHLNRTDAHLYRILVYDCPPLNKKLHSPVGKKEIDWSKSPSFVFRTTFHEQLKTARKVALRLGRLGDKQGHWTIRPKVMKELLSKKREFAALTDDDFEYTVEQKGVDMRIGLDIASIATKRVVDQMILVAGDSDFVPAAKTARREGIDFILDPMGAAIAADLQEHIDGVQTVLKSKSDPPADPPD